MNVSRVIKDFAGFFKKAGFQCFLVGGAVRDMVTGIEVTDYDFATDARPEEVMQLFRAVIPTGIKHGTVTVLYRGYKFEVTTFRTEGKYSDLRHPDSVEFTPSIFEDLKRRDFTINSLAYDPIKDKLLDPHSGREDLNKKLIRAIGDPDKRFSEDALRILRACRFAAQLNFTIEEKTLRGMVGNCFKLKEISAERISEEFQKLILTKKPSIGFYYMDRAGITSLILPELEACKGVEQKGFHRFDVYEHSILSCEGAKNDLVIRLAALFHDIGKPVSLSYLPVGEPVFYRHEEISERLTRKILGRLKFPKKIEKEVCHLIRHHMFNYNEEWKDSAVRRFIARVGKENIENLFHLRYADQYGITGKRFRCSRLEAFKEHIIKVLNQENAFTIKDLDVNGNDLAIQAGVPRGKEMGTVLNYLLETVLDDPGLNKKEKLIEIAKNYYNIYIKRG